MKPAWLIRAEDEQGVSEVAGPGSNPRIAEYFSVCTWQNTDDSVPWCSAFVCAMLEWSRVRSTRSAAAKSFLEWGIEIEVPITGCIVVLTRPGGTKEKPLYHVGFYVGDAENGDIFALSGNYRDTVCTALYSKSRVVSYRIPDQYFDPGF